VAKRLIRSRGATTVQKLGGTSVPAPRFDAEGIESETPTALRGLANKIRNWKIKAM